MGLFSNFGSLQAVLLLYLSLAFTLMLTVFNYRRLLKKYDDFRAFLLYFGFFFLTLMAVPCLIVLISAEAPLQYLKAIGFSTGRSGLGLLLMAAAVPVALLAALVGSRDPVMKRQYPFSKSACSSLQKFIGYETAYLLLYYLTWEFVFRGVLFFPFISSSGLLAALSLQTLLSTLYHIGHPDTEIFASLGAGFIFGLVAYWTGSFLYTVFIHALVGISNDTFLYFRYHRPQT
ncbi:MAG: CPBP family intramembrane glutamic endopeptidase [Candidatus Aminicenantales bacterium]